MTKKQTYVTVVTNGKGSFSYHTSWKIACENYGWDYTAGVKPQMGDYKIFKAPMNVTIDCLDLVEFINRKNTTQDSYRDDEYQIELNGYNKTYSITADYRQEHEAGGIGGSDDMGRQEKISDYDFDVITKILKVELHTDDEPVEIKIDSWTEQQLIDKLETQDYE